MHLRYLLSFLRTVRVPGLLPLMTDWRAFVRMHFIFAAYESGLLAALAEPRDREFLLENLHVERPQILDALLEVGLAADELSVKNGLYRISGKRSRAVAGAKGDMLAAMIQANVTYYSDAYRNLPARLQGGALGEDLAEIGGVVARFSKIVDPVIRRFIERAVRNKSPMRVLDVGCGSGLLLRSICGANPCAVGVGLDVDASVVRQAQANVNEWGLADRLQIRHGDVRAISDGGSTTFDLITLMNVLYYFADDDRARLMSHLRTMLSPTGALVLAMTFRSEGDDVAAANLNVVNSSLRGLTPLPSLVDTVAL